jgi:hypothetical protein
MSDSAPERAGVGKTEVGADAGGAEAGRSRGLSRRRVLGLLAIAPLRLPLLLYVDTASY